MRSAEVVAAEPALTPFITVDPLTAFSEMVKVSPLIVGGKFTGKTAIFTVVVFSIADWTVSGFPESLTRTVREKL